MDKRGALALGAIIAIGLGIASYAQEVTGIIGVPQPADSNPPAVADASAMGTMTTQYALANHTHASKARKVRVTTASDGTFTWTFATPFTNGVTPLCVATAEVTAGVTDVVNVQIVDMPTATQAKFLVNRTNRSVVALLGLTILSVPSSPGATVVHAVCLEP